MRRVHERVDGPAETERVQDVWEVGHRIRVELLRLLLAGGRLGVESEFWNREESRAEFEPDLEGHRHLPDLDKSRDAGRYQDL